LRHLPDATERVAGGQKTRRRRRSLLTVVGVHEFARGTNDAARRRFFDADICHYGFCDGCGAGDRQLKLSARWSAIPRDMQGIAQRAKWHWPTQADRLRS